MEEKQVNNKKKKIILISSITVIALILVVGISYALWQQSKVQEGTNYITSGCFGVTFEGNNPINLTNSFPISDEEGMKTVPYTFTITSSCNGKAAYDVNLESLASTTFQNTSIRVALDSTHKLYNEYEEAETYYNDSIESRRLVSGRLDDGESVTYNLRLWIDEAVTIEEQNKVFASKIVVNANEDFDDPVIENINATSTINSINITYNANGDISTTCKYGLTEGTYDNTVEDATTTDCNITGLTDDTTYYYQICTETGRGIKCEEGNIKTLLDSPEPAITNLSATSTHNSITITYQANGDVTPAVCKYGTSSENYTNTISGATGTRCNITGLNENKAYYYQVCTETKKGNKCVTGNIKTFGPFTSSDVGKYVSMTPTSTNYTISKDLTGYTSDQTINPSELNLWRVVRVTGGGVYMVLEYISSAIVYFRGETGCMNFVETLDTIANQYSNDKFVEKAEPLGRLGTSALCEGPLGAKKTENCRDIGRAALVDEYEVLGRDKALIVNSDFYALYWAPVREYKYDESNRVSYYCVERLGPDGTGESRNPCLLEMRLPNNGIAQTEGSRIRPTVTLKNTVYKKSGNGSKSSPYRLE